MKDGSEGTGTSSSLGHTIISQFVRFTIITLTALSSVWAFLDFLIPGGWPLVAVNIIFFSLTLFFSVVLLRYLSVLMPKRTAVVVAGITYFLIVFLLRYVEYEALSAVFR